MDNGGMQSAQLSLFLPPEVKEDRKRGSRKDQPAGQEHDSKESDGPSSRHHTRYLPSA